jgi:hypothetical protein
MLYPDKTGLNPGGSVKSGSWNYDGIRGHKRGNRNMRPGKTGEVQDDHLRVLNLRRRNFNLPWRCDCDRRRHREYGTGCPGTVDLPSINRVESPWLKIGTVMVCSTVSIQKTAVICKAWAFGRLGSGVLLSLPSRKAMLFVPPGSSSLHFPELP